MNIKAIRKNANLSQAELAQAVGVAQPRIAEWENGKRTPKLENLQKIADACNINIIELLPSHNTKLQKAMEKSGFIQYGQTCEAIFNQIPAELISKCTASQLATISQAINKAYHFGKASMGAEDLGDNSVWIDKIGKIIEYKDA